MYKIYLIDKDGKKLNILQTNSEAGIDSFTTHFESKFEFLKELDLENRGFRVKIEKLRKNEDNGTEIEFLTKKYDGVSELSNNHENELELVKYATTIEDKILKTFFLDELLNYETDEMNSYTRDRYEKLRKINYYFDTLDDEKKNKIPLFGLMKVYFDNSYKNLKRFFIFLTDINKNPVLEIKERRDKLNFNNTLDLIKQKIKIAKKSDSDVFTIDLPKDVDSGIVILKEEDELEDKVGSISDKARDIDELYTELDMYLDEIPEEKKIEKINSRIRKY